MSSKFKPPSVEQAKAQELRRVVIEAKRRPGSHFLTAAMPYTRLTAVNGRVVVTSPYEPAYWLNEDGTREEIPVNGPA